MLARENNIANEVRENRLFCRNLYTGEVRNGRHYLATGMHVPVVEPYKEVSAYNFRLGSEDRLLYIMGSVGYGISD